MSFWLLETFLPPSVFVRIKRQNVRIKRFFLKNIYRLQTYILLVTQITWCNKNMHNYDVYMYLRPTKISLQNINV